MDTTTLPPIGATIIAKYIPGITGTHSDYTWTDNMQVTVTETKMEYCTDPTGFAATRPVCVANFTSPEGVTQSWYVSEWEVVSAPDVIGTVTIPANCTVDEYRLIIERLSNDLVEQQGKNESLTQIKDKTKTVVESWERWAVNVMDRADQEATDRDWCDEYREIRQEVTQSAPYNPGWNDSWGEREYTVEATLEVVANVSYTLMVTATSEDDAREVAMEEIQSTLDGCYDLEEYVCTNMDSRAVGKIDFSINSVRDY